MFSYASLSFGAEVSMGVEFGVWLAGLFVCLLLLFLVTEIFKAHLADL